MSNILDNKKQAKLVIRNELGELETIAPETLATVVDRVESGTPIDNTVQEHIDDTSIHIKQADIEENLSSHDIVADDFPRKSEFVAGENISVTIDEATRNVVIGTTMPSAENFLTKEKIIARFESGVIVESEPDDTNAYLNLDYNTIATNLSSYEILNTSSLKEGSGIRIEQTPSTNELTVSILPDTILSAGDGIEITHGTITNTKPNIPVEIISTDNTIQVTQTDQRFDLIAKTGTTIADWEAYKVWVVGDICIFESALFKCITNHTSGVGFIAEYWEMLAGYETHRQYYLRDDINIVYENPLDIDSPISGAYIIFDKEISNKQNISINLGGIIIQAHNYDIDGDRKTIRFNNPIPTSDPDVVLEVILMSNVVMNTFDTGANIDDWGVSKSYAQGNLVIYKNGIYKCMEDHISTLNFDFSKWEVVNSTVLQVFNVDITEPTSFITIPPELLPYVTSADCIMINVDNISIQRRRYNVDLISGQIFFIDSMLDIGDSVEVTIFGTGVLQQNVLPTPTIEKHYIRTTPANVYEIVDINAVAEDMKFDNMLDGKAKSYLRVDEDETKTTFVKREDVAADIQLRNHSVGSIQQPITGFIDIPVEYQSLFSNINDVINISKGGLLSSDNEKFLETYNTKQINPSGLFGTTSTVIIDGIETIVVGSALSYVDKKWTPPVMTSPTEPLCEVITNLEQEDREGWRAMDSDEVGEGNGWLANRTYADWQINFINFDGTPLEVKIDSFDFYNQGSGISNRTKTVNVWLNDPTNIVMSFDAENVDYGLSRITLPTDINQYAITFGLSIVSSYGSAVGINKIVIYGTQQSGIKQSTTFNTYLIGNETDVQFLTTELTSLEGITLPTDYTHWAKIGSFSTDENNNIIDIYPEYDLGNSFLNGYINGVYEQSENQSMISHWLFNDKNDNPLKMIEQWGTMSNTETTVTFNKPFNNVFYVHAQNCEVVDFNSTGFTIKNPTTSKITWFAKGY